MSYSVGKGGRVAQESRPSQSGKPSIWKVFMNQNGKSEPYNTRGECGLVTANDKRGNKPSAMTMLAILRSKYSYQAKTI